MRRTGRAASENCCTAGQDRPTNVRVLPGKNDSRAIGGVGTKSKRHRRERMNTCPKCGSATISGPTYKRDMWGAEFLVYACRTCQYSRPEPIMVEPSTPATQEDDASRKSDARPERALDAYDAALAHEVKELSRC